MDIQNVYTYSHSAVGGNRKKLFCIVTNRKKLSVCNPLKVHCFVFWKRWIGIFSHLVIGYETWISYDLKKYLCTIHFNWLKGKKFKHALFLQKMKTCKICSACRFLWTWSHIADVNCETLHKLDVHWILSSGIMFALQSTSSSSVQTTIHHQEIWMDVFCQPPNNLVIVPSNYHMFPLLKKWL